MANLLSMAKVNSVHTLHQSGHSNREIARLLGIDRATVGKYVHEFQNQPNAPTGETAQQNVESPHRSGPQSGCRAFHEIILKKLDAGLSAKRIHQDLVREHGYSGSSYGVRRFVARLESKTPLPFRRIETGPGEEAQVDFGTAAPVIDSTGKKRRPWMFRIVLKGFSKQIAKSPAKLDLSDLPEGYGFQYELRLRDTTRNQSKPIINRTTLSYK